MAMTLVEGDLPPDLARGLRGEGWVAVDTETSGLDWATDQLHLCQLFSPGTGSVLLRRVRPAADHSLQALLRRHLGVTVAKGSVRTSDWGAPVLSAEQVCDYMPVEAILTVSGVPDLLAY